MSAGAPVATVPLRRFYIDSNIFVHHFKPRYRPSQSSIVSRFLAKIQTGTYEGIVSSLTLMEMIKILRELAIEFEGVMSPVDWVRDANRAIEAIYRMKNVRIFEDPQNYTDFLGDSLDVLRSYVGRVRSGPKHDGIHPMDAMHIIVAKKLGCNEIATFDRDFDETSSEIAPVILDRDPW